MLGVVEKRDLVFVFSLYVFIFWSSHDAVSVLKKSECKENKYKIYMSEGFHGRKQLNTCLCHLDGRVFKQKLGRLPVPPIPVTDKLGSIVALQGNLAF